MRATEFHGIGLTWLEWKEALKVELSGQICLERLYLVRVPRVLRGAKDGWSCYFQLERLESAKVGWRSTRLLDQLELD